LDVAYFSKVLGLPSIQVYQSVVSLCCTKQDDEEGSSSLKLELAQFREVEEFAKFVLPLTNLQEIYWQGVPAR